MAYDSQLVLRDSAVSNSFWMASIYPITESSPTPILLPGTPLRGLNLNLRMTTFTNVVSCSLEVAIMAGVSTGATHYVIRKFPKWIDTTSWRGGDMNIRFHLDKGYPSVKAWYTISGGTGCSVGNLDIRIGLDRGAYGNG